MKKGKIILLVIVLIAAFIGAKILYDQIIAWQRGQIMDGPGMDQGQMLVDNYGLTWEQAEAVLSGDVKLEDILNSSEPAPDQTDEPEEAPGGAEEIAWNYDEFPDDYTFRNNKLLSEHYDKHGIEMGFASARALHMIEPEHEAFMRKCLALDDQLLVARQRPVHFLVAHCLKLF